MKVVVTGMGVVSPAGRGVGPLWNTVIQGRSCFRPITRFSTEGFYTHLGGEVPGAANYPIFNFLEHACDEAMRDARFEFDPPHQIGVALGTTLGANEFADEFMRGNVNAGKIPPRFSMYHALAGSLADRLEVTGPCMTFDVACASSIHAIGYGFEMIRSGRMQAMITGGVDFLSPFVFSGFHSLQALARGPVRPFDADRDGMIIGEGAGILILESEERARRRGARIHAEIRGWGFMGDAVHLTAPDKTGSGMARTIRHALHDTDNIGYISAHGTATRFNDRMETIAIKETLGAGVPVSSIKASIGHCLGASAAIETIVSIRALQEQRLPPTLHYEKSDPECDLDYVPNEARDHAFDSFLKLAAGFGGQNGALVVGRLDG